MPRWIYGRRWALVGALLVATLAACKNGGGGGGGSGY